MQKARIGKLPPKYTLLLNPHAETRLSTCPHCRKLSYPRKFALLIFVEGWQPYTQGKTCKYCSKCKLVMVDQGELEAEIGRAVAARAPHCVGKSYAVLGVVELKEFKRGLSHDPATSDGGLEHLLAHTSDFRKQEGLGLQCGGWYLAGTEPPTLPAFRDQRAFQK